MGVFRKRCQCRLTVYGSCEFNILFMKDGSPSSKDRVLVGVVWRSKVTRNELYDIIGTIG
jgi:hypothetical protein